MTTEQKPRHKFPKSENPRDQFFKLRMTKAERDLVDRCVKHASMGRGDDDSCSSFVRHLITMYAADNGIPFDPTRPALTADELCAKLGIEDTGPAPHLSNGSTDLEGNIDPDRYDESNTSTIDPLPERKK